MAVRARDRRLGVAANLGGGHERNASHVWAAFLLGGAIISLPISLALLFPGRAVTRHVIAVAQMLSRAPAHPPDRRPHRDAFPRLRLAGFPGFYRDWRVLVTGTVVVAADHISARHVLAAIRFMACPPGAEWRWLEHAGWVVFNDLFLIYSCLPAARKCRPSPNGRLSSRKRISIEEAMNEGPATEARAGRPRRPTGPRASSWPT